MSWMHAWRGNVYSQGEACQDTISVSAYTYAYTFLTRCLFLACAFCYYYSSTLLLLLFVAVVVMTNYLQHQARGTSTPTAYTLIHSFDRRTSGATFTGTLLLVLASCFGYQRRLQAVGMRGTDCRVRFEGLPRETSTGSAEGVPKNEIRFFYLRTLYYTRKKLPLCNYLMYHV